MTPSLNSNTENRIAHGIAKAPAPATANKRSASQRAADRAFIAHHHLNGATHAEIASMLCAERGYTLSRQQVTADLKKMADEWREQARIDFKYARAIELEGLRRQEKQCWKAWGKSQENLIVKKFETLPGDSPQKEVKKISIIETERCGNPSFMLAILSIRDIRCKIFGLYQ